LIRYEAVDARRALFHIEMDFDRMTKKDAIIRRQLLATNDGI